MSRCAGVMSHFAAPLSPRRPPDVVYEMVASRYHAHCLGTSDLMVARPDRLVEKGAGPVVDRYANDQKPGVTMNKRLRVTMLVAAVVCAANLAYAPKVTAEDCPAAQCHTIGGCLVYGAYCYCIPCPTCRDAPGICKTW